MRGFIRVCGLPVAAILLVSATLLAHSSGGVSSSGGSSHGGSGSSSSGSSHGVSGGGSGHSHGSGGFSSSRSASHASSGVKPARRGFFSFFRHKKPVLEAKIRQTIGCRKGENCACAGGGSRNAAGMCVSGAQFFCSGSEVWNGFACGRQAWFNDCRSLANELRAEERLMQGQVDPGQSLRHQMLVNQYQHCLQRSRMQPFSAYAFNDARPLDVP